MNDIDQMLKDAGTRLRDTAPTASITEDALRSLDEPRVIDRRPSRSRRWMIAPAILTTAAAAFAIVVATRPDDKSIAPSATPGITEPAPSSTPTTPLPTAGWTDVAAYPSDFGQSEAAGNATGSPSPALTADPAPLANGTYALEITGWEPHDPTKLLVSVRSIVRCADGVPGCSPLGDGTYGPDDVGFSAESRQIELTLDDSVTVYLGSQDIVSAADGQLIGILRSSDGTGLAALMSAIADAYTTAFTGPLNAGASADDIVTDLQTNPRDGFTSAAEQLTGQLWFSSAGAPPVLFQTVADQGQPLPRFGTSVLIPRVLTVENGAITLELYAGFRS